MFRGWCAARLPSRLLRPELLLLVLLLGLLGLLLLLLLLLRPPTATPI